MEEIRVLIIDPMSRNNLGIYDKNLIENLKVKNIFFYCNKDFQFSKIENIKIYREYKYHTKKGIIKIFSYIISQIKLIKIIDSNNINTVHFQWFKIPLFDYFFLKYLKRKYKSIKIIHTAHNVLPHDSGVKYFKIYKKIYKLLDRIIVHTKRTKSEIVDLFKIKEQKIEIIPHGLLEIENIIKNENKIKIRENDEIIFSLIGMLNTYKGIDLLIEAWESNEELYKNSNIKLIIAGKGKVDFSKIKKLNNVTIINRFLKDEEIEEIINQTDVALLPYRKISQSGVLLSMLAKRKPILVSNVGGLTQPFEVGNIGWIMNEITSKELYEKIKLILREKEKIEEIKNNIQLWREIECYYSWEAIGKKTKELYEVNLNEKNML